MKQKSTFQTGNVIIISFAHMVHDVYSSFLSPILPLLIDKLGISYGMVGLLVVFQRIPSLLNPIVGILAERMSLRYLVIIAPAITTISMSLLGVAPNYWVLVLLLLIMGIGSTLFHVPAPVMIRQVSGNQTGKGMSFFMLGGELARTLGPITILGAVSWWGLEGSYKLIPLGLFCSGMLFFKFKNIKFQKPSVEKQNSVKIWSTLRQYSSIFLLISGITFFRGTLRNALITFLPTFMHEGGSSLWMAGIYLSIFQFAGAGGTLFSGIISDKIGRRATLVIAALAIPVFMLIFMQTSGIFQIATLIILGFFMFAFGPVLLAIFQDLDSEYPAFVNSIYMTLNFMINSLTTLMIGIMGDKLGLEHTFRISIYFSLGVIPLAFLLKLKK